MENEIKKDLEEIKVILAKIEERIKFLEAKQKPWVLTSDCFDHNDEDLYNSLSVPSTQATNKFEV